VAQLFLQLGDLLTEWRDLVLELVLQGADALVLEDDDLLRIVAPSLLDREGLFQRVELLIDTSLGALFAPVEGPVVVDVGHHGRLRVSSHLGPS
jgi:hypothetical protein